MCRNHLQLIFNYFGFSLIHQAVSFWEEKLCFLAIFLLDVVIVEVIHHIKDVHSAIYWLIEHQRSWLHVERNDVLIEYRAVLEVRFCCKFQCFLSTID